MKKIAIALLLGTVFAVGCGDKAGGDGKDSKSASAGDKKDEKKDEKKSEGGGDKIGVKECDEYMDLFKKCIDKVPAEGKAAMQQGYDASVKAWKDAAAQGGPAKDALAQGCKAALDAMAQNPACK
ncbi:MAG: hypothetical protein JNL21_20610 [Myxococcales bacterium]|nr:hypothetical protein [Myxococcales bacterium]